jgi:hypothetical protein
MNFNYKPLKFNVEIDTVELSLLRDCVEKRIEYIRTCDFEKEFQPLDFTREDALELLVKLDRKLWDIK